MIDYKARARETAEKLEVFAPNCTVEYLASVIEAALRAVAEEVRAEQREQGGALAPKIDQAENEPETVTALTALVREADRAFARVGGGSRDWVRDCFLPLLNRDGWAIQKGQAERSRREAMAFKMGVYLGSTAPEPIKPPYE